jgi:hypothetical protein
MGQTTHSKAKYALVAVLYTLPLPAVLALHNLPFLRVSQLAGVFLTLCILSRRSRRNMVSVSLPAVMALTAAAYAVGVSTTEGSTTATWFMVIGVAQAWTLRSINVTARAVGPGLVALSALPAAALFLPQSWAYAVSSAAYVIVGFVLSAAAKYFKKPLLPASPDVAAAVVPREQEGVKISVVLPSYNAGTNLLRTVEGVHKALQNVRHEVLVINDGSTDSSCLFDPVAMDVRLISKSNGGKGTAVAVGVLSAAGEWVAFLDADGDIAPSHLERFLCLAESAGADSVVGSKKATGASSSSAWYRRLYSFGFQSLQRTLLSTGVQDSQAGCKLVKREHFIAAVRNSRERGFLLDLELLSYMHDRNLVVLELPIQIESQGSSTVNPGTVLKMFSGVLILCAARVLGSAAEMHETNAAVLDNSLGAQHAR